MALGPRPLSHPETLGEHSHLVELLFLDGRFKESTSFREQCYFACRILRTEHDPPVPFALLGKGFGVDRGTIRNHAKKYAADLKAIGCPERPSTLRQDEIGYSTFSRTTLWSFSSNCERNPETRVGTKKIQQKMGASFAF
jgi:hypothetical protein